MASQEKKPKKGMEIDIDATCQVCHAYVDGAEYFATEKVLKWTCAEGHDSFIEEFRL